MLVLRNQYPGSLLWNTNTYVIGIWIHGSSDPYFCIVSKLNFKYYKILVIFANGEVRAMDNWNISQKKINKYYFLLTLERIIFPCFMLASLLFSGELTSENIECFQSASDDSQTGDRTRCVWVSGQQLWGCADGIHRQVLEWTGLNL